MNLLEGQIAVMEDTQTGTWQAMTRLEGTLVIMKGNTREEAKEKIRQYVINNRHDGFGYEPDWS
jgi:hypothetical protein